jgi:hypothetical protein
MFIIAVILLGMAGAYGPGTALLLIVCHIFLTD